MNALTPVLTDQDADIEAFRIVRAAMPALAQSLSAEDLSAQAMADASPGKWHLAHTSWFFEAMILASDPDYRPVDPRFQQMFNSYYEALGKRVARAERGLMTRPSLADVMAYRREIDRRMTERLAAGILDGATRYLFTLGLHHDQQHQELFLMDLLYLMSRSPLDPAAYEIEPLSSVSEPVLGGVETFEAGVVTIGHDGKGFAFDNEGPDHPVCLGAYALDRDLVTNRQWQAFIDDGNYAKPDHWLADGWATVQSEGWTAPLYWQREGANWTVLGLTGRHPVDPDAPVRHVSYYEADAFARWSGRRLSTEAEWEHAAKTRPQAFSNLFGQVWQHTASPLVPYPGFRPTDGTASEYNAKFMANQSVLRGGSFATPQGHARTTYRNFFYPHQRWAFMGVRLANDVDRSRDVMNPDDSDAGNFRDELIEGLSKPQKSLSPKWFYDAVGSELFEDITRLEEYYPTRQEAALLRADAAVLTRDFGPDAVLVEFGSGASEKTRIVLDAATTLSAYVPIDISSDALQAAATRIEADYPGLTVVPIVGDFLNLPPLPDLGSGRRIGFFPGSTIGNLSPEAAIAFLKTARTVLGDGALFILGVDLVKEPELLIAAYDDAQGVTAAFNLNVLRRANDELGADFDLSAFEHRAIWNGEGSRMEMHLRSAMDQIVTIGDRRIVFQRGETIHTESSRKFTAASVTAMAETAGWTVARFDVGPAPSVALAVLEAA